MEHDLKRLLAYHTVENIGIIFIGLGLSLAFKASGLGSAAALALVAAIFHVFNHSLFKSLLFLGSGAVLKATGERDMEHLGGLIHRMPVTAVAFLAGCIAISALPPFNGFVSEWLTFQAILLSPQLPQWVPRLLVPAIGATLACSAALAAACFVKAFGMTFLGRPRSGVATTARETDRWSRSAMLVFAALCLLAGVLPGFVIDSISPVTQMAVGSQLTPQSALPWFRIIPINSGRSAYDGLLLFVMILIATAATAFAVRRFASHALRRSPAWDCGFPDASPATQYTAGSFAQPIRRVFGSVVFRAREHVTMPKPGDTAVAKLRLDLHDTVWEALYLPVIHVVEAITDRLNKLQFLTIRNYLTLVFASLVLLLIIVGDLAMTHEWLTQLAQAALVLGLAPLLSGVTRKIRARLLRRQGPSVVQPYRDLLKLIRKEAVVAENASWLFRAAPYAIFATTWVAATLGTHVRHRPHAERGRRPDRDRRAPRYRALPARARRTRCGHKLWRNRLEPRNDVRLARGARDADGRFHALALCGLHPARRSPLSCWDPTPASTSRSHSR